jgi:uncharacterized membrane protein YphA (DoxX/SURF4 family)
MRWSSVLIASPIQQQFGIAILRVIAGIVFVAHGAILLVHAAGGFFLPAGLEFVLMLFGAALAILFAGPGALSVDGALASRGAIRDAGR